MGWWRIDPESGRPAEGAASALSRPPDFLLLNAVPGVDDEVGACYLGDGPSDIVSTMPAEIAALTGGQVRWSADPVRDLFLQARCLPALGPQSTEALLAAVRAFWSDIDGCYEDDWGRSALPAERRWICEELIERLTR